MRFPCTILSTHVHIVLTGDPGHRPFVSGEPDIISVPLSGKEDFLVLGCDGLWDHVTEDDVAWSVYKKVREDPGE